MCKIKKLVGAVVGGVGHEKINCQLDKRSSARILLMPPLEYYCFLIKLALQYLEFGVDSETHQGTLGISSMPIFSRMGLNFYWGILQKLYLPNNDLSGLFHHLLLIDDDSLPRNSEKVYIKPAFLCLL